MGAQNQGGEERQHGAAVESDTTSCSLSPTRRMFKEKFFITVKHTLPLKMFALDSDTLIVLLASL